MEHYAVILSRSDYALFSNELLFAQQKHEMKMNVIIERQKRWNVILVSMFTGCLCLIVVFYMFFRCRLASSKKKLAEQETEYLRLELSTLEEERNNIASLLKERPDMTPEMMKAINERLNMLNSLLAKEITSNESYARPLIDSIKKDREGFLKSTRTAFSASHPEFMKYLYSHFLTEDEINYVCLYAIGLRGKDIGEYIQLKRHYVMGSAIRKKLGIDEHETNLGPYIRRLLNEF